MVELAEPLAPIELEERNASVLLVPTLCGTVLGHVPLFASRLVSAEELRTTIVRELGDVLPRELLRLAFRRATRGLVADAGEVDGGVSVVVAGRGGDRTRCHASLGELRTQPLEVLDVDTWAAGAAVARGELVACTKATCVVDPGWLDRLGPTFADPLLLAVTGYVGPLELAAGTKGRRFARRTWGIESSPEEVSRAAGTFANAVVRARLPPDVDLGRSSNLFAAVVDAGYRVAFDPARIVWGQPDTRPAARGWASRIAKAPRPASRGRTLGDLSLSVVIPSHQRRKRLTEVLEALAQQSLPSERFEVIVVLDGSTDGSAEAVLGLDLPYRLRLLEQPHSGTAAARNRGAEVAEEPVLVFLDDDLVPEPQFLAEHSEAHADGAQDRVVLGDCPLELRDHSLWSLAMREAWQDHFTRKAEPDHVWTYVDYSAGNSSLRRSFFRETGGFDERFRRRYEDEELGVRLLARGARLAFRPEARVWHRLDTRFRTQLAQEREAAYHDVLLARTHPQVLPQLTLARLARPGRPGMSPRAFRAYRHPVASERFARLALPLVDVLDAWRRRRPWKRLTSILLAHAYVLGLRDALRSHDDYLQLVAPLWNASESAVTAEVSLDREGTLTLPPGTVRVALAVAWAGRPLATFDAIEPGEWRWDAVTERAVDYLLEPAKRHVGLEALLENLRESRRS